VARALTAGLIPSPSWTGALTLLSPFLGLCPDRAAAYPALITSQVLHMTAPSGG